MKPESKFFETRDGKLKFSTFKSAFSSDIAEIIPKSEEDAEKINAKNRWFIWFDMFESYSPRKVMTPCLILTDTKVRLKAWQEEAKNRNWTYDGYVAGNIRVKYGEPKSQIIFRIVQAMLGEGAQKTMIAKSGPKNRLQLRMLDKFADNLTIKTVEVSDENDENEIEVEEQDGGGIPEEATVGESIRTRMPDKITQSNIPQVIELYNELEAHMKKIGKWDNETYQLRRKEYLADKNLVTKRLKFLVLAELARKLEAEGGAPSIDLEALKQELQMLRSEEDTIHKEVQQNVDEIEKEHNSPEPDLQKLVDLARRNIELMQEVVDELHSRQEEITKELKEFGVEA